MRGVWGMCGCQGRKLIANGIGHGHPADFRWPDFDASRPKRDETIHLRLLITANRWCDVETQPVLTCPRHQWRTTPGDLRATTRRLDRGLLVLVPEQRPAQRLAPEVTHLLRTVAVHRSDKAAAGKKVVPRLDHAELISLGVSQHHMSVLGPLTDVDMPGGQPERPRHGLLLVLNRRARQIKVDPVLTDLLLLSRLKPDPEPDAIARREDDAVVGVVDDLPAPDAGPKAREPEHIVRIEAERDEVQRHPAPHLRSADSQPWTKRDSVPRR